MSSYDDLLKQVEHLRAENSHLRQELNDNTSNLSKLENEASTMKDVFSQIKVPMEEDDDIPYDDYEEEGIHVFAQGGGGESCDMNPNEEDVSPNDVGPLKPTFNQSQSQTQNIHGKDALLQLPNPARPGGNNIVKPQIPLDGGMLNLLRELHNERAKLLNDIEEEGKQRKWYFDQIEAIKRKLESLPVPEKHNRQLETARRQLEFEVKRVQDSFEQNMGTNDQIVQRQEARLQRIQVVETDILRIQDQHRRQMEAAVQRERAQESHPHQMEPVVNGHQNDLTTDGVEDGDPNNVTIATQTSVENDDPNSSVIDPNASFTLNALYHGAWPMSPMKKDLAGENRAESLGKSPDLASVMSFNSTNSSTQGSAAPSPPTHAGAMQQHQQQGLPTHLQGQSHDLNATNQQQPQQLGTKVEMVYSLLSMLGTHDKDDMSRTLLAMSSSQDSCIAMRQSGCMPLLIQLLHGSDKDSGLLGNTRGSKAARARAAAALHNIVHSHPDDKRGRREARVLRLLEQIRAHSDQLRESPTEEEEESRQNGSRPHEMDHHPGPAVAALMKLSFDEEHRHAICSLGLQRRMRNLSPMLLYMNCRNHRLALCLKHLMKQYPLLVEADEILLAVWKIFHFSPRRFEVFKNIQEVYGQQPLNVIRAATTRWLSHGQACVRFIDRYQAILDTLDALYDERKEPEVFGLRASIARKNVVAMILLLCDVLRPVNLLSLYLQDPKICFVDIEAKVKATTNELENLINSLQAPNFTQNDDIYFSKVVGLFQEIDDRTALNRRLRPQGADGNLTPDSFIQTIGVPFIYSLIGEMTDAFNCHPVFQAFRALDPRCVPQHADDLTDFGKADIETLARHYGMAKEDTFQGHVTRCEADIDNIDILKREYIGFKHQMFMLSLVSLSFEIVYSLHYTTLKPKGYLYNIYLMITSSKQENAIHPRTFLIPWEGMMP